MPKIKDITCHRILNSRGDWTIETMVELEDGSTGVQSIPSGASTGENEAISIPVYKAVEVVNSVFKDALVGKESLEQEGIDKLMIQMDGTSNKKMLGGNSMLSVSLAVARASAISLGLELYEYLEALYKGDKLEKKGANKSKSKSFSKFPTPVFNILNGGKHAHNDLSVQEFMVIPAMNLPFDKALDIGVTIYKNLKELLESEHFETGVGDEGGFAPKGLSANLALDFIKKATEKSYKPGEDVFFGMDVAAGSFYEDGVYEINEENLKFKADELSSYFEMLFKKYEIIYCEDPFYENDHKGWQDFYEKFASKLMIVGDDLVVTNTRFLSTAAKEKMINAVIVKPNQVGTLTETLDFVRMAKKNDMSIVVSHRSGDTAEDTFISDLSVAVEADFIKSGAPVRGERVAKYNRLLEIFHKAV